MEEGITASRSPWQNPNVEPFLGSEGREYLDHEIVSKREETHVELVGRGVSLSCDRNEFRATG